jgi:hypothetical protein
MAQEMSFDRKVQQIISNPGNWSTIVELRNGYIYDARDNICWSPHSGWGYYSGAVDPFAGTGDKTTLGDALRIKGLKY